MAQPTDTKRILTILKTRGGCIRMRGTSMMPVLAPGWKIYVTPSARTNIHPGKIIAFQDNERMVIHRCLRIFRIFSIVYVVQKGDSSNFPGIIPATAIIGIVTRVENAANEEEPLTQTPSLVTPPVLLCITYLILRQIKRCLLGNKKTRITSCISRLLWSFVTKP